MSEERFRSKCPEQLNIQETPAFKCNRFRAITSELFEECKGAYDDIYFGTTLGLSRSLQTGRSLVELVNGLNIIEAGGEIRYYLPDYKKYQKAISKGRRVEKAKKLLELMAQRGNFESVRLQVDKESQSASAVPVAV